MSSWKNRVSKGASLGVGLAGAVLWACSSGSSSPPASTGDDGGGGGGDAAPSGVCARTDLKVVFAPMYSAFVADGQHDFQIPAIVEGVTSGVTWTASDTSAVDLAPFDQGGTMITVRAAGGPVTINAYLGDPSSADTKCGSSVLTITSATQAQWQAGSDRYNNGHVFTIPDGGFGDAGVDASDLQNLACTNCHGATATNLPFKTIAHTPEQAGGFSDTELQDIISKGKIPAGGYFDDSIVPRQAFPFFHHWNATPDELTGLVVYLRSLTPTPQGGSADFGGLGGGGGGGSSSGGGSDSGSGSADSGGDSGSDTDAGGGGGDAGPG